MKKLLSIILVLTLVAALVIVPALAAEDALHSFICPACGGSAYSEEVINRKTINVSSCMHLNSNYDEEGYPHTHYVVTRGDYATCYDCGYGWFTYVESQTNYCNNSLKYVE